MELETSSIEQFDRENDKVPSFNAYSSCPECNMRIRIRVSLQDGLNMTKALEERKKNFETVRFCPFCRKDQKFAVPFPSEEISKNMEDSIELKSHKFRDLFASGVNTIFSDLFTPAVTACSIISPDDPFHLESREFKATRLYHEGKEMLVQGKLAEARKMLKESSLLFWKEGLDKEKSIVDSDLKAIEGQAADAGTPHKRLSNLRKHRVKV